MWKWRDLSQSLGKTQMVKTFLTPTFLSKAALISVSNGLILEINKSLYGFIWEGNDKESKDVHLSTALK